MDFRLQHISLQEENWVYTSWCNTYLASLVQALQTSQPVLDLIPERLLSIPERQLTHKWPQNQIPQDIPGTEHINSQSWNETAWFIFNSYFHNRTQSLYYSLWNGNHLNKIICTEFFWRSDYHFMFLWLRSLVPEEVSRSRVHCDAWMPIRAWTWLLANKPQSSV